MFDFTYRNTRSLAVKAYGELVGRQWRSALLLFGGLLTLALLGWADPPFAPVGWFSLGCLVANAFAFFNLRRSASQYADDTRDVRVTVGEAGISCSTLISSWGLSWEAITHTFSTRSFIWVGSKVRAPIPLPIAAMPEGAVALIAKRAPSRGLPSGA